MYIPPYSLYFLKVLPDYSHDTCISYLTELLNTIEEQWDLNENIITDQVDRKYSRMYVKFNTTRIKQEFTNDYLTYILNPSILMGNHNFIHGDFWDKYIKGVARTECTVNLRFDDYIHFYCNINPLPTERSKYEYLFYKGIETGIIDYVQVGLNEGESYPQWVASGKLHWLYLYEKLKRTRFKKTNNIRLQTKSPVYELSCKIKTLLDTKKIEKMEIIGHCHNQEYKSTNDKELLYKCDKILLDTWGRETFSNHLKPLNISLEYWLQAI